MMKVTEKEILEFIDGYPDEQERLQFMKRLQDDPEALSLYHELLLADQYMSDLPLESPSEEFNEKVLTKVRKVQRSHDTNRWLILGVGILVAMVALAFFSVGQVGNAPVGETALPDVEVLKEYVPSVGFDFNGIWEFLSQKNVKQLIIIVDIFIVFLFIDRFLLKHFFRGRSRASA